MGRKLKSSVRTIIGKGGQHFKGEYLSPKGPAALLGVEYMASIKFDSISSFLCGIYCEHRRDVSLMEFEKERSKYTLDDGSTMISAIHDHRLLLSDGEIEYVEAKYSRESLSEKEAQRLELLSQVMVRDGHRISIIYRDVLEANGFIQTVLLLRRYGHIQYTDRMVQSALERLDQAEATDLRGWRKRSLAAKVPTGLLYHLLYHQRLALLYRPLVSVEFLPCQS